MIPLLVMLGAMALGFLALQVAKKKAMEGVFVPPVEQKVQPPTVIKSDLEGKI